MTQLNGRFKRGPTSCTFGSDLFASGSGKSGEFKLSGKFELSLVELFVRSWNVESEIPKQRRRDEIYTGSMKPLQRDGSDFRCRLEDVASLNRFNVSKCVFLVWNIVVGEVLIVGWCCGWIWGWLIDGDGAKSLYLRWFVSSVF